MTHNELLKRLEQALKAEAFEEAREYQALLDDMNARTPKLRGVALDIVNLYADLPRTTTPPPRGDTT